MFGIPGNVGSILQNDLDEQLKTQLVQQQMAQRIKEFEAQMEMQRARLNEELRANALREARDAKMDRENDATAKVAALDTQFDPTSALDTEVSADDAMALKGTRQASRVREIPTLAARATDPTMADSISQTPSVGVRRMTPTSEQQDARGFESAVNSVPSHLIPMKPAIRAGLIKVTPDSYVSPEERAAADARERQKKLEDYEAQKQIDARYRAPVAGPQQAPQWITDPQGNVLNRVPQPGDKPYDKAGNAPDRNKAEEVRAKILDVATRLRDAPGRTKMTGTRVNPSHLFGWYDEPVSGTDAADAHALFKSLQSVMTLENLGLLKGVLSDRDMQVLQSAATALQPSMSDPAFEKELNNIIAKVGGAASGSGGAGEWDGKSAPQKGQTRTYPNGRRAEWDGQGWAVIP